MHEGLIHPRLPLVAYDEAAEVAQPGEQPLDHPALLVAAQLALVVVPPLRRPMAVWDDRVDAAGSDAVAELVAVELLVHHDALRVPRELVQRRLDQLGGRRRGRRDG